MSHRDARRDHLRVTSFRSPAHPLRTYHFGIIKAPRLLVLIYAQPVITPLLLENSVLFCFQLEPRIPLAAAPAPENIPVAPCNSFCVIHVCNEKKKHSLPPIFLAIFAFQHLKKKKKKEIKKKTGPFLVSIASSRNEAENLLFWPVH